MPVQLVAISGSLRDASLNTKLLRVGIDAATKAGAKVTHIDLKSLDLPMYNQEIEDSDGLPKGCIQLKNALKAHDGMLLACPEYNGFITAALKNAIDWASRPREGEAPLECFDGKAAGLIACSQGALGGLRGLATVRSLLGNIRVHVHPKQYAAGSIDFDESGMPTDSKHTGGVRSVAEALVRFTASLSG